MNDAATTMDTDTASRHLRWLWVSLAVIAADVATKATMVGAFRLGEERPVTPFFSLILTYNTGAAFSFGAGNGGWQRWAFSGVAVIAAVLIVWLLKRGGSTLYCLGLSLILGGAIGNLWDRLAIGSVVDFLLLHYERWAWPAFNVADSAISIGAALLIIDSFGQRHAGGTGPRTDSARRP